MEEISHFEFHMALIQLAIENKLSTLFLSLTKSDTDLRNILPGCYLVHHLCGNKVSFIDRTCSRVMQVVKIFPYCNKVFGISNAYTLFFWESKLFK